MGNLIGISVQADSDRLASMGRSLIHRGGLGKVVSLPRDGAMAGITSGGSVQPWRRDNLVMVGEISIFNTKELLALLAKENVRAASDDPGDVLLALWAVFGPARLDQINGDFALAIANLEDGTVNLVRDRSGARPLYYARVGSAWVFASEYKALLVCTELDRAIDKASMQMLHARKVVPAGQTLLKNVSQVPAQSVASLRPDGGSDLSRYWQVNEQVVHEPLSSHAKKISKTFLRAVERRVATSEKLGISVSGGVDSIAMVAAVRAARPDAAIRTYTIGDSPDDPELTVARRVAERYKTEHFEQIFSTENLQARLKQLVRALEDPIARTESLMTLDLCSAAAGDVEVMLRGDGADGLFGGMARHKILALAERVPFAAGTLKDVYTYTQSGAMPSSIVSKTLIKAYFRSNIPEPPTVIGYSEPATPLVTSKGREELLNRVLRKGAEHALPMLLQKVERPHAQFGMTTVSPFLDNELVSAAHQVPSLLKNNGQRNKIVFREATREFLPDEFARLPKYAQRVRETSEFCDAIEDVIKTDDIIKTLGERALFNVGDLQSLMQRPQNGIWPPEHAMRIWTLILTEYWFREFIQAN